MSRKTRAAQAVLVAGAVAATSLFTGGSASAATPTVTKVGPVKAATTTESVIAVTGTNFSSDITGVKFYERSATTTTCVATSVVVVSATLLYAKKPAEVANSVACAAGQQKVELLNGTTSLVTHNPGTTTTDAAKTVTFAVPQAVTGISPAAGLVSGGQEVTVTVNASPGLPATSTEIKATLGGKPLAAITRLTATTFKGKTPAGAQPGAASLVVTTSGVPSAPFAGYSYKQSLKAAPAFAPVGTPGQIMLTGVGLKPASPATVAVTVCGVTAVPVTPTTAKPYTDTKLWVTAPAAADIQTAQGSGTFATDGGACVVKVTTDVNGATADVAGVADDPNTANVDEFVAAQVNPVSVITSGSTFTYTAF